jgi:hypothetical protein
VSIRRRLERLEAGAGESAAQWENLRDMHPLLRQKHLDEACGFANYTVPPDLSRLYALGDPRLSKGGEWVFRHDWNTAYSIQFDLELLGGLGMGYDLLLGYVLRDEEGGLEASRAEAQARLEQLAELPPERWHEVYRGVEEDTEGATYRDVSRAGD